MKNDNELKLVCQICKESMKLNELAPADLVRPSIVELIRTSHKEWNGEGYICFSDLNHFRELYIKSILEPQATRAPD